MQNQDILSLWKTQESKIDQLMSLNLQLLREQQSQKMKKAMWGMKAEKITGIAFGSLYLLFLGAVLGIGLKATDFQPDFFTISVAVIFIVNIKVFSDYIRHLVMANQIRYDGSVAEIQAQLIELKFSLIRSMRIVAIQLPFYSTFHLSLSYFPSQAPTVWLITQLIITGLFTVLAVWIFVNFKPENADKKWVKWMISTAGGTQIEKSLEQLEELESFKNQ
ncbi:hypothetical protein [Algoriphagus chordae]|uniref:Uncharacterized protein n=1 Tax=Algoriphagus chordae TaxID=237019 RepID=A0A2W7RG50_9BACT|nr:hypothetical protein [Algoriphagus chordae]PZX58086.1 hypothetical protein LV85_00272 [Algoriphagus chordae]